VAKCLTKFALFDKRKMAFWWQNPLEPKDTQYSAVNCFFLRKVEAKSLKLFWQDFLQ